VPIFTLPNTHFSAPSLSCINKAPCIWNIWIFLTVLGVFPKLRTSLKIGVRFTCMWLTLQQMCVMTNDTISCPHKAELLIPQPTKKFSGFYGTQDLITVFTRVRHFSLSWDRSIQSTSLPPAPPPLCFLNKHFNIIHLPLLADRYEKSAGNYILSLVVIRIWELITRLLLFIIATLPLQHQEVLSKILFKLLASRFRPFGL
jgi:hypothetical protein